MTSQAARPASRHSQPGITLVELLVVITIILVIAALSLVGMRRMQDYGDKVNSLKNLSRLQLASASYASDHNGQFVPLYATNEEGARTGFWYQDSTYLSYLIGDRTDASGQPLRAAPSQYLDPKVIRTRKSGSGSMAANYGMSEAGLMGRTGPNVKASHSMNNIPNPAAAMAFATAADYRIGQGARFTWVEDVLRSTSSIAYRHFGKALVVYFDGHAGELSKADMREMDSRSGRSNAFWNPRAN